MSSSRPGGSGETSLARSMSSSVVSPMADTTTTTSWPAFLVATMRWATLLMLTASATEEPPYFCTTMPTGFPRDEWLTRLHWQHGAALTGRSQSTGSPRAPDIDEI